MRILRCPIASARMVHLWTVQLHATATQIADLDRTLSQDEKRRADSFRFEQHRDSFIISRGLLRALVGSCIGESPDKVNFQYGPYGKPTLSPDYQGPRLHFNLAHAGDFVSYAFTRICEVGVDLEPVRELPEIRSLSEYVFGETERNHLLSLAPSELDKAFIYLWTRKEAFLKATGEGLSVPLKAVQVPVDQELQIKFVASARNYIPVSQWTLFHFAPVIGYIGAVAIPSVDCALQERFFDSAGACLGFLEETPVRTELRPTGSDRT